MVTIEVTDKQAHLIREALDLYVRLNLGQFDKIKDIPTIHKHIWENHRDNYHDIGNDELLRARNILFDMDYGLNGSYGINSDKVDDFARLAQDIIEVIRYEFWKVNPKRSNVTVDSSITLRSKLQPNKIKVSITDNDQTLK
jgi:hypothetical protein